MGMATNWIDRIIYDAGGGNTGNTYYMRIVRRGDIKVWNPSTKELVAASDIAWADSYTLLIEQGPVGEKTGVYAIAIQHDWRTRDDIAKVDYGKSHVNLTDAQKLLVNAKYDLIKNIPSGTYDIIVYKQSGSEPDHEDDVEKQWETKIGSIFGF